MYMHFDHTAIELIVKNNIIIDIRNPDGRLFGIRSNDYPNIIELIKSYDKYVNN